MIYIKYVKSCRIRNGEISSGFRPKARQRQSAWAARRGVANDAGADGCATEVTATATTAATATHLGNSERWWKMVKDVLS